MNRHAPRYFSALWLCCALAISGAAPETAHAKRAIAQARYSVTVVKVSVQDADGRRFQSKPRAIRSGETGTVELIVGEQRHTFEVATGESAADVSYRMNGGSRAERQGVEHGRVRIFEQAGEAVFVEMIPTVVSVGVR